MQWYHKTKCMFLSHYITVAIRIRHNLRLKNEASFPRIIFEKYRPADNPILYKSLQALRSGWL
jgi:hypothetical protein